MHMHEIHVKVNHNQAYTGLLRSPKCLLYSIMFYLRACILSVCVCVCVCVNVVSYELKVCSINDRRRKRKIVSV